MSTPLNTIISWFVSGAIPTEGQFAASWSSFRHLADKILMTDVEGLNLALGNYVTTSTLNSHINDTHAHGNTMASIDASNIEGANLVAWKAQLGINNVAMVVDGEPNLVYSQKQVDDLLGGYNLQSSNNTIKITTGAQPDLVNNVGIGEEEFPGLTTFDLQEFPLDIIGVFNDGVRLLANDWVLNRPQEIVISKGTVGIVSVVYTKIIDPV